MRVLVIDDEKAISGVLKAALESAHFAVDVAEDGEQGLRCARMNDYDAIVLDNVMPKKDGVTVCKELRESGKTTPILSLSVQRSITDKIRLLESGADDYLCKPFALDELIARLRALVRRPHEYRGDVFVLDDLRLDSLRHRVTRSGEHIRLTRKEFMLLEHLLRNEGVVVSRSSLIEHVWDNDLDPFSNTIEAHVMSLRKKIERAGRQKLIHTVSGRGYVASARPV